MRYYIMRQETEIEGSAGLDGLPPYLDPSVWLEGKKQEQPNNGNPIVLDLSRASGDYRGDIIDGFITLYSDELKEALEEFGVDNVEFFPVRLRDQSDDTTEGGYWIANVIGRYDCVDLEKSQYKMWVSGIGRDFESIVIDESKTNGAKIFRASEAPTLIMINEELKQYFDETDLLVGVRLTETAEYSDW